MCNLIQYTKVGQSSKGLTIFPLRLSLTTMQATLIEITPNNDLLNITLPLRGGEKKGKNSRKNYDFF